MTTYLSDKQYLAIKPEATPGTAVIPTNFVPLVSESIKTVLGHTPDRRMKGIDWSANQLLRVGNRSHEGDVVVLGDPDVMGHLFNMLMTKGSTTGNGTDGYTHPFTVGDADSYTFEISRGLYAQRYFGVKIDELKLDFQDGRLQLTAAIKAMGQCGVFTLKTALTGAGMTSIVLDDEYDIAPTRGLVAGDIVVVGGVDCTVVSVTDTTITISSATVTASAGAVVYLKQQSVSLATLSEPFYMGNVLVGFGVDETASTTAAGDRATATPVFDLSISFKQNLFVGNGTNRMDPVKLLPQSKECEITVKQLFESAAQRQAWLDRAKQAITMVFAGKYIKSDQSTKDLATFKFYNVGLVENDNPLKVGEYIMDEQKFAALFDNSAAKAITLDLVNRTAGTAY